MSSVGSSFSTKILILVLASATPALFAQNGAIQGRIVDPTGAVIAK